MDINPYLQLGLGLVLVTTMLVLFSAVATRRHRELVATLARKYSLGVLDGKLTPGVVAQARRFRGRDNKVKLGDILVGTDEDGTFYAARRRIGRTRHQLLVGTVEGGLHIENFHVEPRKTSRRRGGMRLPRRDREGDAADGAWRLDLSWSAPPAQWTNERSISMGARVLYHVASVASTPKASILGVEIHDRQLLIHSVGSVRGKDLDRFLADSLKLRRGILRAIRKTEGLAPMPERGSAKTTSLVVQRV